MKAKTILAALRGFFTGAEDENASWKCFICLVIRLKRNELDFDVCGAADCVLFNQLYFICLCEISLYRGGGGGGEGGPTVFDGRGISIFTQRLIFATRLTPFFSSSYHKMLPRSAIIIREERSLAHESAKFSNTSEQSEACSPVLRGFCANILRIFIN
jgi:hypothetical protein